MKLIFQIANSFQMLILLHFCIFKAQNFKSTIRNLGTINVYNVSEL